MWLPALTIDVPPLACEVERHEEEVGFVGVACPASPRLEVPVVENLKRCMYTIVNDITRHLKLVECALIEVHRNEPCGFPSHTHAIPSSARSPVSYTYTDTSPASPPQSCKAEDRPSRRGRDCIITEIHGLSVCCLKTACLAFDLVG